MKLSRLTAMTATTVLKAMKAMTAVKAMKAMKATAASSTLKSAAAWTLAVAALACSAAGAEPVSAAALWVAVPVEVLDEMRGGYTSPAGLAVSLGIERSVSLNGELISRTTFHVADMRQLGAAQAAQTRDALSSVKLLQQGSENIYLAPSAQQLVGATVIQNSLADQHIQSSTIISASVNSSGLLKTINFQDSLNDALTRAAAVR